MTDELKPDIIVKNIDKFGQLRSPLSQTSINRHPEQGEDKVGQNWTAVQLKLLVRSGESKNTAAPILSNYFAGVTKCGHDRQSPPSLEQDHP